MREFNYTPSGPVKYTNSKEGIFNVTVPDEFIHGNVMEEERFVEWYKENHSGEYTLLYIPV